MAMEQHAAGPATPGRLVAWTSLLVGLVAMVIFGSVVAGVGEWVEGRELQTVAPWAIPALVLAAVSSLAASRALMVGKGSRAAAVLAVCAALTVVAMILANPSIAPPVP